MSIARVFHADHVLRLATETVFGAEDDLQARTLSDEHVDGMHEVTRDGRGVGQNRDVRAAYSLGGGSSCGKTVESGEHGIILWEE